ncbi:NisI/SpaI family lantibiotic immunity lipoprotein [Clostridium estertheticum]|uniref:NisI/SpaI family lantibiotic immunity lipoprotein n=1 Tax=Clostridium estertheticum TaxID=238834 RepID=A0A5N7J4Z5_9CLOT|nr:NisI/SpaI family lantibiotic immunity lipoprotein [Clostridium estertheticum]MPQ33149.1 NisI/SpaI family lantibiotic immunity lipoprotein [Clostridium estertheticum]MPQ63807.1 NisI/SpaI family lantibiotic immunity lipoprotein [Clostridium estertheticum]
MKTKKTLISLLAVLFCTLVIGYFAKDTIIKKVMHYQIKDKIVCKVNSKNATQISYKEVMYQISNVSLDSSKIEGWNGIINQVAVINKNNCILEQKEIDSSAQLTIKDIKENISKDAKFIVSFLSVCSIKGTDNKKAIAVQVNNQFYKAVPVASASTDKTAIKLFTEELH